MSDITDQRQSEAIDLEVGADGELFLLMAVKRFEAGISARRRVLGGSWRLKR